MNKEIRERATRAGGQDVRAPQRSESTRGRLLIELA